jgi:hypothetical protein
MPALTSRMKFPQEAIVRTEKAGTEKIESVCLNDSLELGVTECGAEKIRDRIVQRGRSPA